MHDVVSFYSSRPRMGKSTAAIALQNIYGYMPVKFAGPLKHMAFTLLQQVSGLSHSDIHYFIEGDGRNDPLPLPGGPTSRHLMQTLGTEWGRVCINPDLWSDIAKQSILHLVGKGHRVVIDDMRFENEMDMLLALPCKVATVHVKRKLDVPGGAHASEGNLDHRSFTHYITNDGTKGELEANIQHILG